MCFSELKKTQFPPSPPALANLYTSSLTMGLNFPSTSYVYHHHHCSPWQKYALGTKQYAVARYLKRYHEFRFKAELSLSYCQIWQYPINPPAGALNKETTWIAYFFYHCFWNQRLVIEFIKPSSFPHTITCFDPFSLVFSAKQEFLPLHAFSNLVVFSAALLSIPRWSISWWTHPHKTEHNIIRHILLLAIEKQDLVLSQLIEWIYKTQ